jgi:hypothetical protein
MLWRFPRKLTLWMERGFSVFGALLWPAVRCGPGLSRGIREIVRLLQPLTSDTDMRVCSRSLRR